MGSWIYETWFWVVVWSIGAVLEGGFIYLLFQWAEVKTAIDNIVEVRNHED